MDTPWTAGLAYRIQVQQTNQQTCLESENIQVTAPFIKYEDSISHTGVSKCGAHCELLIVTEQNMQQTHTEAVSQRLFIYSVELIPSGGICATWSQRVLMNVSGELVPG